jgi:predicted phage terminase large subunit-like protein
MQGSSKDRYQQAEELNQDQAVHSSLLAWSSWAMAKYGQTPARHHRLLLERLDSICRGEIDRLMVLMPPGSAKSTYGSLLFPPWWFTQHPRSSVIAASHTASLAEHFGRQARELVREYSDQLGYGLHAGRQAASHWHTTGAGEYFAAGVRGPLTGHRADLVVVDDPIKSQADADSPTMRERLWSWYRFDLTTRLKPRGRIVLIMTRWHEDDLAGRLLTQNTAEWHLLRLPALAEEDDPLERPPGTALWPEWEDADALLRRRDTIGERAWAALYQQSPRPLVGCLFKTECIEVIDAALGLPDGMVVRAWDLAATSAIGGSDPDWTAGVKLMRERPGRFIVLDIVRLRGTPHQVEAAIAEAARIDGTSVGIGLPEDPGQAGKHQAMYLAGQLAGYRIDISRETGAKVTRAVPVASQIEAGNFAIVRAEWNHSFLEELRNFPFGRKDDQVDALSRAFRMLTGTGTPARHISLPMLAR